jgi:hypothetical protein
MYGCRGGGGEGALHTYKMHRYLSKAILAHPLTRDLYFLIRREGGRDKLTSKRSTLRPYDFHNYSAKQLCAAYIIFRNQKTMGLICSRFRLNALIFMYLKTRSQVANLNCHIEVRGWGAIEMGEKNCGHL